MEKRRGKKEALAPFSRKKRHRIYSKTKKKLKKQ